jgi:hypothetical protein
LTAGVSSVELPGVVVGDVVGVGAGVGVGVGVGVGDVTAVWGVAVDRRSGGS